MTLERVSDINDSFHSKDFVFTSQKEKMKKKNKIIKNDFFYLIFYFFKEKKKKEQLDFIWGLK